MLKKFFILLFSCFLINVTFAAPNVDKNKIYPTLTPKADVEQKININTADVKMLQTIKGIGPKKAAAIVNYRNEHGKFHEINDLLKIPQTGINQKWLDKISAFIACY